MWEALREAIDEEMEMDPLVSTRLYRWRAPARLRLPKRRGTSAAGRCASSPPRSRATHIAPPIAGMHDGRRCGPLRWVLQGLV